MNPQNGRNMDGPPLPGSIRRARERAAAGLPREVPGGMDEEPQTARPSALRPPTAAQPRTQRPPPPFPLQTRDGQIGVAISKPTQVPQWPLPGPLIAPVQADGEPYRPPPGKSHPPQRPPRPSRVPSILDASKVQDPTPSFQYRPRSGRESSGQDLLAIPETPSSQSRPSTLSSVASIPDFPLPIQTPAAPSRRSVNLGPPPSARRGASSFYSNASFVSPIPEESPRARSHTSFASSAAMPENWGSPSVGPSPDYPEPVFADAMAEEGGLAVYGDDDAEESQLVRSASLGKRAKPTLVSATAARVADGAERNGRPGPTPIQDGPFKNGTGYVENSSSSSTIPTASRLPIGSAVTADSILNAYSSASAEDPSSPSRRTTPSPNPAAGGRAYSRLSAVRRPPRLDIDAVRKAESRGSLTSLPDLIRRATRLAASLEKGRRPASRFDDLDNSALDDYYDGEKYRSGLSDMLAAFPPPAQPAAAQGRRSIRDSIREQVQSWPLPINFNRTPSTSREAVPTTGSQRSDQKRGRRCCGLPLWGFIILLIVILIIIAAAVVIPVEFFVIRRQNADGDADGALQQCRQQLTCANGGTNAVSQGTCSCVCINGFTGSDCTVVDDRSCTTVSLAGANNNNVTIGDAIPRLVEQAQSNFSIPLSSSEVLAKLEAENLSCSAENALVTFEGRSARQGAAQVVGAAGVNAAVINGVLFTTITVMVGRFTTVTIGNPLSLAAAPPAQETSFRTTLTASGAVGFGTTLSLDRLTPSPSPTATSTVMTTVSMPTSTSSSGGGATPLPPSVRFTVNEEVLDFARVAVLFIFQESSLVDASAAQVTLQKFFTSANSAIGSSSGRGVSVEEARNVTVGGGRSVDLVDFAIDLGGSGGRFGGAPSADV